MWLLPVLKYSLVNIIGQFKNMKIQKISNIWKIMEKIINREHDIYKIMSKAAVNNETTWIHTWYIVDWCWVSVWDISAPFLSCTTGWCSQLHSWTGSPTVSRYGGPVCNGQTNIVPLILTQKLKNNNNNNDNNVIWIL